MSLRFYNERKSCGKFVLAGSAAESLLKICSVARMSEWPQLGDWRVSGANDDRAVVATGSKRQTIDLRHLLGLVTKLAAQRIY